jgi:DNA-binding response OmpR family regulator
MLKYKTLLVDDDAKLRQNTFKHLTNEGYEVSQSSNLKTTFEILQKQRVQALVLEVVLPDGDVLDALPEIKRQAECPIVIMSTSGQLPMRLKGLKAGADYYLVKPTPLEELSAVLSSLLRSSLGMHQKKWRMDSTMQTLIGSNGHWMYLTASEWVFIHTLQMSSGLVVSREKLVRELGKDMTDYNRRNMDTMLQRLRLKAKQAGLGELPLRTRHGQGYVWTK